MEHLVEDMEIALRLLLRDQAALLEQVRVEVPPLQLLTQSAFPAFRS